MEFEFRWNWWNVEHIALHGVARSEAEYVVTRGRAEAIQRGKFIVRGQTEHGRYIQVIYIFSPRDVIFVIHARPLTEGEKRKFRRRRK
jgi:uncharacterized protein